MDMSAAAFLLQMGFLFGYQGSEELEIKGDFECQEFINLH
jgi:hypothetical protein